MLAQGTDDEYDSETDQGSCVFTLNLKIRKFIKIMRISDYSPPDSSFEDEEV